jgi:hypothetical protein
MIIFYFNDLRSRFICTCIIYIALPSTVPALSAGFLINFADSWKPRTWLIVYSIVLCVVIVVAFYSGIINTMADLPLAVRKEYSYVDGTAQTIPNKTAKTTIMVDGVRFELSGDDFYTWSFYDNKEVEYTVIYLPNTKYVIDIIDASGASLIRKD